MKVSMKNWLRDERSMLTHLILDNIANVKEVTNNPNYNADEVDITIHIAGVEVELPEFTSCVNDLVQRSVDQIIKECGIGDFDARVQKEVDLRYNKMLEERSQKALDDLSKIEELASEVRSMLDTGLQHIEWK